MRTRNIVISIPVTDTAIISKVQLLQEAVCTNYPQMEQYLLDPNKLEIKLEMLKCRSIDLKRIELAIRHVLRLMDGKERKLEIAGITTTTNIQGQTVYIQVHESTWLQKMRNHLLNCCSVLAKLDADYSFNPTFNAQIAIVK